MIRTVPILRMSSHKLLPSLSSIQSSKTESITIGSADCEHNHCSIETETKQIIPNLAMIKSGYCSSTVSVQTITPNIADMPTLDLLLSFAEIDQDTTFKNNGYKKIKKICDTLQGELFKAIKIDSISTENPQYVTIKKTKKTLFEQRIAIQDDINFCVSENIIKESLILKYLTIDNTPIGDYIVKFIDFFESDTAYYLVMEYIESQMNLKQFITVSHQYIKNGTLLIKDYNKMIKYLLWQLFVTIQWLHIPMHCCHLDLCMENIMLIDANFIETDNGVSIDPSISIKLCDFGAAEVFKMEHSHSNNNNNDDNNYNMFLCEKQCLSLENELYFAPKVFNGDIYDAQCADNWCLGIILFECYTNQQLYGPMDIHINSVQSGYWALHHKKLKKYLAINDILKKFNVDSFDLLNDLLNIDQYKRLKGIDILKHKWFKMYYKRYKKQISKKFKRSNTIKMNGYDRFPFYH